MQYAFLKPGATGGLPHPGAASAGNRKLTATARVSDPSQSRIRLQGRMHGALAFL